MLTKTSDNNGSTGDRASTHLARRYRSEKLFQLFGVMSITFGVLCVLILFSDIIYKGHSAFIAHSIKIPVYLDSERLGIIDVENSNQVKTANYDTIIKSSMRNLFPDVSGRKNKKQLYRLISSGSYITLQNKLIEDRSLLNKTVDIWFLVDDDVDTYLKHFSDNDELFSRLTENQISWLNILQHEGRVKSHFNYTFFSNGDSREPEQAGIYAALMGSFYTLLLTLLFSFPIAVSTAVYLEEFAPKNKWTDLIEVNINNLAAVPSVIFGLLGLAVFINFFGVPRSTPLVGGFVLTLMTLPTIIISSRAAIKSVPPSIREAALGIGASKMQTIIHHVLPLSLPGMLTGTIIGMAQALGETAPLLMIGMIAFIVDVPNGVTDPSTVLPVQIFLWADSPERAFSEKTSAAIMVLLAFLIAMNGFAIFIRKRLERRW